ncbi:MAG: acyltransferase family protein [Clostridia bacterium]|nr:acyltransferase family protein [Clostridia bacterium]
MKKTISNKNGLIELFRFLCSIWVAYYHGFFPILSDKFDGVNISVDFFFMVSGLFFLRSIEKYREKPFLQGVRHIFWGRTKGFIVPLIIAASSILFCNIAFALDFGGFNWPLSFLWFFAAQFVYLTFFYVLLRLIKRRSMFNLACVITVCLCMSLFIFMSESFAKQFDRVFRGPAMLALGILISQIPQIKTSLKDEIKAKKLNIALNAIGFTITAATFIYLAYLPGYALWKAHLFTCLVCPLLLYFALAIPVKGKFFNFLGEISIFIYLAQCPILIHHYAVSNNTKDQFPLFCVCIVSLFLINRTVNYIVKKQKQKKQLA